MYKFKICIGDWSGDGHDKSQDFLVSSNKPVEAVREAHYEIANETGVDIEDICSRYEEDEIDEETVDILKDLGFQFEDRTGMGDGIMSIEEMAKLWLFLLEKADPDLKLEIIPDDIPRLQFYGFDEKGRHIRDVGYGLFH